MGADLLDAGELARGRRMRPADRGRAGGRRPDLGVRPRDRGRGAGALGDGLADAHAPLPGRSMTIVGDVAQTGDLAAPGVLAADAGPYLQDRWRLAELTINYRTPAEIMAVAADVLAAIDPGLSCRGRCASRAPAVAAAGRARDLASAGRSGRAMAARTGDGRLAVIVPAARLGELGSAVRDRLPGTAVGEQRRTAPGTAPAGDVAARHRAVGRQRRRRAGKPGRGADASGRPRAWSSTRVLIADPGQILAESPRGLNDLYVAHDQGHPAPGRRAHRARHPAC